MAAQRRFENSPLRRGVTVRLRRYVQYVPPGYYRFEGRSEEGLILSVRGGLEVLLPHRARALLTPVSGRRAPLKRMTLERFVAHYAQLHDWPSDPPHPS